jgi:hypothetical protein
VFELRPNTVQVRAPVVEQVAPFDAVTVYPVIGEPPSESGTSQVRLTLVVPGTASVSVGAPGLVAGVALRLFEAALVPTALVALTVKE